MSKHCNTFTAQAARPSREEARAQAQDSVRRVRSNPANSAVRVSEQAARRRFAVRWTDAESRPAATFFEFN